MTVPPRISVLLPVRDAVSTLPACLSSLLRQTERSWECVAVDDGSSDGSGELLREIAAQDARFTTLSAPPRGLVASLNEGLAACRGAFVARMDADDIMHRARLSLQSAALAANPALSAVGCHVRLFPRRSLAPRLREYEEWLNGIRSADDVDREAFVECPVAHPTLMMRREMAALGYRDLPWPEDYDLLLRARRAGMRIGVVARRLLAWRNGAATLSRTDARYGQDRFTACKAHFLAGGFLARAEAYVLCGYGSTGRALRRALLHHRKRPSHIVEIKKERLGQRIHGAAVVPYSALPGLRGLPVVVSVARSGPRAEVRRVLRAMGFAEGLDYVCAA